MRLGDAPLRGRKMKAVYPDHRFPSYPNEAATPRSLEPIVGRTARSVTCGHPNATTVARLWHSKPISAPSPSMPPIEKMPSVVLARTQGQQLIALQTKQPKLSNPAMK